jgi:hypothetical protein
MPPTFVPSGDLVHTLLPFPVTPSTAGRRAWWSCPPRLELATLGIGRAPRASPTKQGGAESCRFPRIDDGCAGALEIPHIPGNYGQIVGKRGRRNH